jgi:NAD(P)-dependent dehydrogenase (short-subunit alcohol dehydrogenase family)
MPCAIFAEEASNYHSASNFGVTETKMSKVAVVTGSNKGIGLAIVKGLVGKFDGDIYLTARSEERGLAAVEQLKKVRVRSIEIFRSQKPVATLRRRKASVTQKFSSS